MDKIIVISHPQNIEKEHGAIESLFENGLKIFHLRKPTLTLSEMQLFLEQIPSDRLPQITLHDHFELAAIFPIGGLHLNARHKILPKNFSGRISCSCHSFEEVGKMRARCDYVFLSPIFESISKQNYQAAFSFSELKTASKKGIIDKTVVALGGILPENINIIQDLHFGGIAILGYLWGDFSVSADIGQLTEKFKEISTKYLN